MRCPACGHLFLLRVLGEPSDREPAAPEAEANEPETVEAPVSVPETDSPAVEDPAILERRARRLARALLGDLMRGREKERKKALSEGTVLLVFGEKLESVWREYRERLPREFPKARDIFRKVANDILAEGKQLF